MKIGVISFTRQGAARNLEVVGILQDKKHQAASFSWHKYTGRKLIPFQKLDQLLADLWEKQDAFVFISDTELAIRAVIPFMKNGKQGPAVYVMDEGGNYVLTLLSGALAGASDWCRQFAKMIGAVGVSMEAVSQQDIFSLDDFACKNRLLVQDVYQIRRIKEALAAGQPVGIYSDYPIEGVLPEGFVAIGEKAGEVPGQTIRPECGIAVTDNWEAPFFAKECRMYPKNLVMAVYCDMEKTAEELERFVGNVLTEAHLSKERISAVFSLEDRTQHPGILQMTDHLGIPFFTYSIKQLCGREKSDAGQSVPVSLPMAVLCDRCALLGSHQGRLLIAHKLADGMMISVCEQAAELAF